jgi:hypothetical protein
VSAVSPEVHPEVDPGQATDKGERATKSTEEERPEVVYRSSSNRKAAGC